MIAYDYEDLELSWEVPADWGWFMDDPASKTMCKTLCTEEEIYNEVFPHCPLIRSGQRDRCLHYAMALDLFHQNWGLAVFKCCNGIEDDPILIPRHWHEATEQVICITGGGIITIEGVSTPFVHQPDIIEIPSGIVHSKKLAPDTRWVVAYQLDGEPNFGLSQCP